MSQADDAIQLDDSPLAGFLEIDQDVGAGGARCRIHLDDRHLNPNGSLHGGVLFTLLDLAMGLATNTNLEQNEICATSEIHIRYLKPVFRGPVEATATVLNVGTGVVQLEAKAANAAGEIVASATGSFVKLERREASKGAT